MKIGSKLYSHELTITVNGNVVSYPRIVSTSPEPLKTSQDLHNRNKTIVNPSNVGTLIYAQFDLIYLLDIYVPNIAVRIFNITNGRYDYSTDIILNSDTVTEL